MEKGTIIIVTDTTDRFFATLGTIVRTPTENRDNYVVDMLTGDKTRRLYWHEQIMKYSDLKKLQEQNGNALSEE